MTKALKYWYQYMKGDSNALRFRYWEDGEPSGYKFLSEGIELNAGVSGGVSYTYYVGTARKVDEELRKKSIIDFIKESILG